MTKNSLEVALIKYNRKTWCKSALLGGFIGLAVIVPGISGSTAAIIFKLYDQFLYALSNIFKKFKACFIFLLPILLGVVVGVGLGFIAVKKLLEILPFAIVCLFAGLMSGAFPAVTDEIKERKRTSMRIALFCVGLLLPVLMGAMSAYLTVHTGAVTEDAFMPVHWWQLILAVIFGAFVGLTQIMPGLSASAFMMAVGWFGNIVESISLTYWQSNPQIFLVYVGLAVGFLTGVLGFSKLISRVLATHRNGAYTLIAGLSIGSILAMFCNSDIIEVYYGWMSAKTGVIVLNALLGAALFALGALAAYALVRYQRKHDKAVMEQMQKEAESVEEQA